ncbi:MAG TPA: hypothetical protein VFF22_10965 [Pseudomonas sp.]|nr:hypothetical protein [Pseudomonas sp.]
MNGKNEPVEAFEPLGLSAELSAAQREELEQYDDALQHYRTRRWELAEQSLQQLRSVHPQTKLYRIYLERIRYRSW